MKLETASRKKAKIKMAIQGPSGSGKTKSSLLLAYGLTGDMSKIAVIDSENRSSELFASLGNFKILPIQAPFTPEKYSEAIAYCVSKGMEVVIIDSVTHEWAASGGILDLHGNMPGNSFTNWNKLTPRHDAFVETILQTDAHIIATIRSKQDYILIEKDGKQVPQKVGMKPITRKDLEYDFTLVFELDMKHQARVSKDRTELFTDKPEFVITTKTGKQILSWCNQGLCRQNLEVHLKEQIKNCTTLKQLLKLYDDSPDFQESLLDEFSQRRQELTPKSVPITNKTSVNGTTTK